MTVNMMKTASSRVGRPVSDDNEVVQLASNSTLRLLSTEGGIKCAVSEKRILTLRINAELLRFWASALRSRTTSLAAHCRRRSLTNLRRAFSRPESCQSVLHSIPAIPLSARRRGRSAAGEAAPLQLPINRLFENSSVADLRHPSCTGQVAFPATACSYDIGCGIAM